MDLEICLESLEDIMVDLDSVKDDLERVDTVATDDILDAIIGTLEWLGDAKTDLEWKIARLQEKDASFEIAEYQRDRI